MWNERTLDFSFRVGFEVRMCRPYRAQTKGCLTSSGSQVSLGLQTVADGGNRVARCEGDPSDDRWACHQPPIVHSYEDILAKL